MNRTEHLDWAKVRALEYNDVHSMWGSFLSDMSKHPELKNHAAIELGNILLLTGNISDEAAMKKFINDFN